MWVFDNLDVSELKGKEWKAIIAILLTALILLFISPLVVFWIGYLGGWIIKLLVGKQIVAGLALFNITVELNNLPLIIATITFFANLIAGAAGIKTKKNSN